MRRREFVSLLGGAAAWPLAAPAATAQPSDRVGRIAMLSGFAATDPEAQARVAALQQGLKDLGWLEGRNLSIDFSWGTGEREEMRALARELIDLKPDLIVGVTTPAVTALVQETRTIPILFVNIVDPVGRGFVSNMARPGGNVTGFLNFEFSMGGKWRETLKRIAPAIRRVAPNTKALDDAENVRDQAPMLEQDDPIPVRRGPGRPPGSKNRPKQPEGPNAETEW